MLSPKLFTGSSNPQLCHQVAKELQTTLYAVYKAKSRILMRIRQELGDLEEGV